MAQNPTLHAAFELVASVPWSATELHDVVIPVVGGAAPPPGVERPLRRSVPALTRGADGTLWLFRKDAVTSLRDGVPRTVSVTAAEAGQITDIAPTADGGLVVLGVVSPDTNVLARLDASGQLRWRRTGKVSAHQLQLRALQGTFTRLLQDADGTVYLPGTRIAGEIARIDLDSGETKPAIRFAHSEPTDAPVLGWGRLFDPPPADGQRSSPAAGGPVWLTRDIRTGVETRVPAPLLGEMFAMVVAGLPNGGGLVLLAGNNELVWLRPNGAAGPRLAIAGAAPTEDGLVVGTRDGDDVIVSHWRRGELDRWVRVGGEGARLWLEHAGPEGYHFTPQWSLGQPVRAIFFDAVGQRRRDRDVINDPKRLIGMSSQVDVRYPVVEPDGAVLLAGASAAGTYVVRARITQP